MAIVTRNLKYRLGIPYFLSAPPLLAVAILILNDHYLKAEFPSWWTGKISDFAGLFFTPLFLCAAINLLRNVIGRSSSIAWLTRPQLVQSIIFTDILFVAIKLSPAAATFYIEGLRTLGFAARVAADPSDLIAVSVSVPTYIYGRRFL